MSYIGRFAPSPTGPLHFGSLIAAVASYCDAKANQGKWLVRMEDLDKPREMAGAASIILRQLEAFGFEWDKQDNSTQILYQGQRSAIYENALQTLKQNHQVYPCTCSRKEIADSAIYTGIDGVIYPKTCLMHPPKTNQAVAYRAITTGQYIVFDDDIQGEISQDLASDIGDFIVKRADGLFAYQLAVVVDDATQNISHIVRGADLLASTPRQIYLQRLLGFATPHYAHVPVACNSAGEKLSKQTLAKPIEKKFAVPLLIQSLNFLGQQPHAELALSSPAEIWQWAIQHWQIASVPKAKLVQVESLF